MIDKELIASLKLFHGSYNAVMMALFFYQGWIGLSIRRARLNNTPIPFHLVRRHRKFGPLLALFGGSGFLIGIAVVLLDTGKLLEYPLHLVVGMLIVAGIAGLFAVSKMITAARYRGLHAGLGLLLLTLYVVQFVLGLGILL